ncbi:MAG: hypothetical protein KGL39_53970 [Patescibacteria group bacterium]|nr:hypothetical protein [Patescibacteria group bacterium]
MPVPALRPFNRVFEDRYSLIGDYKQLLPETDDLTLMVLKGHLILEEMLFALVREHCAKPEYLEGARLSFAQLLRLARSLVSAPVPKEVWTAIAEINRLRNALAHNLRPTDVETRVEEVYRAAIVGMESLPPDYSKPVVAARILQESILSLIGALALVGGVSELLRSQGISSPLSE